MNIEIEQSLRRSAESTEIMRIPILESQKEIWLASVIGGEAASKSYNLSLYEHLTGNLDVDVLKMSLQELVTRHESLRATFSEDGTEMIIKKTDELSFEYSDLYSFSSEDREKFIAEFLDKNAETALDLVKGPLFKTALLRLEDQKHLLSITYHHIICDGFSSNVLMKELCYLYNQRVQGLLPDLEAPVEFREYAFRQQQFLSSSEYHATERFWLEQFEDNIPIINIPPDFERPATRKYCGAQLAYKVSESLSSKFRKTGFKNRCSSAISLRAVLEVLLYKVCGQKELVTGMPVAAQFTEEDRNLVGHCASLLPLKSVIDDSLGFADYLVQRRNYILGAFSHHKLTFSSLLNKLNVPRDPSRVPLVPVVLNTQSGSHDNDFRGLTSQSSFNIKKYETFEITVHVDDSPSGMNFKWDYNTSLFGPETIAYFHQQFEYILEQVSDNPAIALINIRLMEHPFRRPMVEKRTVERNFYEMLSDAFNKNGNKPALVFGGHTMTYAELDRKSNQFARLLRDDGVAEGDKVGISVERSMNMIVALMGILKAGASYLPLDRTYPAERISQIIVNSDLACLIRDNTASNIINGTVKEYSIEKMIRRIEEVSDEKLALSYSPDNLIYVLHTSGSTGKPKGVCMNQLSLSNLLLWQAENSTATVGTKTLQFSPITFDVSFQEIFSTLTTGGTLHLITDEQRIDGLQLLEEIESQKIERLFLPFVALQSLAETAVNSNTFPTHLREVITAGEQLKITPHIEKFFARLRKSVLYNQYGPTEAHVVTQFKLEGPPNSWPTLPPIGTPIFNCEILILDECQRPVYPGVPGELFIGGAPVSPGYLNLDDITREKFIFWNDEDGQERRIYKTGDLVRMLPDGNIEYLDRIDHQVKIRGYRIELLEVELQVAKLPDISLAAAKVQSDMQGNGRLIAYYVPHRKEFEVDSDTYEKWRRALSEQLPEYMIPFDFVRLEQMPMTSTGKINRNQLPEVKEFKRPQHKKVLHPRTSTEEFLTEIWRNALGIEELSMDDNFFELGGNSLLAVKVVTAIQKEKKLKLPLSSLFENSTIEKLAKLISDNQEKIKWHSLVPIKTTGSKTPIYLVHGGGLNVLNFKPLEKLMDDEQPIYALQALGLNGESNLLYSMEEIANHYIKEILNNDPVGPYALGGYSLGGLLAFEMARQLMAMGKQVSSLAILDTYAGGRDHEETVFRMVVRKVTRQLRKPIFFAKSFLQHPWKTFNYQMRWGKNKIKNLFAVGYQVDEEFFTYEPAINESYDIAYRNYKMRPLEIKVNLFRAKERLYYLDDADFYGWKEHAKDGVNIYEVPGDHKTFLKTPNIDHFAKALQTSLDRAT